MLSLVAATLYLLVSACCIVGAVTAARHRQMPWHLRTWIFVAVLFTVLAVMRVFALEDALREHMRLALYTDRTYEERRSVQIPIVASIMVAVAAVASWWFFSVVTKVRGRRNIATTIAKFCAAVMIVLLTLRLISLHSVDAMLYGGPVRLNWIIDIGASVLVMGSAIAYWRIVGTSD